MEDRPLAELEVIELIAELVGPGGAGVELGIGDDAALYRFAGDRVLLTVDSMYEGVHFSLRTHSLFDVGWRAIAAGASDIAAMGGEPSCALVSLGFAEPPTAGRLRSLFEGMLGLAGSMGCELLGGDVSATGCGLAVTVTVAGVPGVAGPVTRGGAGPGELVGVTGTVGDSGAGLRVLMEEDPLLRESFPALVEAHLRPQPQIEAGALLAGAGVSAMEDLSDGLARDLFHICEASGTGCEIQADSIPLSEGVRDLARRMGLDPLDWALGGGEDYQLVFAAPEKVFGGAMESLSRRGIGATGIGYLKPAEEGYLLLRGAESLDLREWGYEHFA